MSYNLFKSTILVLIISNSANFFAYLFQFLMGRYLNVEDFGILISINSLGVVVGGFFGVLPIVVAKYVIELKNNEILLAIFVRQIIKYTFIILICLSGIILINIEQIVIYLNLTDYLPIVIFLFSFATGVILNIFLGVMQGLLLFVDVSIKSALVAFVRLIAAIFLVVWLGKSYNAALFSSVIANLLITFWAYKIVKKHISFQHDKDISLPRGLLKKVATYAIPVGLTTFVLGLATHIDTVLVKHYISEIEAGKYAVASIIGKISLFLPGVLLSVLFPQVSQNQMDDKSSFSTLLIIMGLTLILSLGFSLLVNIFPDIIILILFGKKYIGVAKELIIITYAMGIMAIVSVIYNYFLARKNYSFLYGAFTVILLYGIYILYVPPTTSIQIAYIMLYGSITMLIVSFLTVKERKHFKSN